MNKVSSYIKNSMYYKLREIYLSHGKKEENFKYVNEVIYKKLMKIRKDSTINVSECTIQNIVCESLEEVLQLDLNTDDLSLLERKIEEKLGIN